MYKALPPFKYGPLKVVNVYLLRQTYNETLFSSVLLDLLDGETLSITLVNEYVVARRVYNDTFWITIVSSSKTQIISNSLRYRNTFFRKDLYICIIEAVVLGMGSNRTIKCKHISVVISTVSHNYLFSFKQKKIVLFLEKWALELLTLNDLTGIETVD